MAPRHQTHATMCSGSLAEDKLPPWYVVCVFSSFYGSKKLSAVIDIGEHFESCPLPYLMVADSQVLAVDRISSLSISDTHGDDPAGQKGAIPMLCLDHGTKVKLERLFRVKISF